MTIEEFINKLDQLAGQNIVDTNMPVMFQNKDGSFSNLSLVTTKQIPVIGNDGKRLSEYRAVIVK